MHVETYSRDIFAWISLVFYEGGEKMSLFSVFLIGIGLYMDACAVSFAKGICVKKQVNTYGMTQGLACAFFQALMPLIGWSVGTYF